MRSTTPEAAADRETDLERRFAALVSEHGDRAVGLAWRLVGGDAAAAEDVAQEALLRAWQALGRFRDEARLSTWLYRIVVREAARHRRWRSVRQRLGGLGDGDARDLPDARSESDSPDPLLRARIAAAIDRLPRGQREAFVLVHLEGFAIRETAELTGRAPGTIKTHLHRALRALRRDLESVREPGPDPAAALASAEEKPA